MHRLMKKESLQQPVLGIGNTYESIRQVIEKARSTAYRTVNFIMVAAYWNIGKIIVEEGAERQCQGSIWQLSCKIAVFTACKRLRKWI